MLSLSTNSFLNSVYLQSALSNSDNSVLSSARVNSPQAPVNTYRSILSGLFISLPLRLASRGKIVPNFAKTPMLSISL